jgi:hypothetical protein
MCIFLSVSRLQKLRKALHIFTPCCFCAAGYSDRARLGNRYHPPGIEKFEIHQSYNFLLLLNSSGKCDSQHSSKRRTAL